MIIRRATLEDLPNLFFMPGLQEWKELIEENLKESLLGKNVYLVAIKDDTVVGQVYVDVSKQSPTLSALRVKQEFQNQGIGTALIKAAEEEIKKRAFGKVCLDVNITNIPAKHLYKRLGYKVINQYIDKWSYTKEGVVKTFEEEVYCLEKILAKPE